jgi:SAM-dependent methyltransferase
VSGYRAFAVYDVLAIERRQGGRNVSNVDIDKVFAGSIPEIYDTLLVPLIFEPYAADLARRVVGKPLHNVLEIAAGTGVVTRAMASALAPDVDIVATDLNPQMIDRARAVGTARSVEWRPADAMGLPFADASFDAVVCQFGAMFFPDRKKAFSEARRVLRAGGSLLFNVWDRIEENEFADVVTTSLHALFPEDPPLFMRRTPHGYFDTEAIRSDLAGAGFTRTADIVTLAARSRADSPRVPAIAYCQGTPLQNEIIARGPARLREATDIAAEAIARRFGRGAVDGKIQAHVVVVES